MQLLIDAIQAGESCGMDECPDHRLAAPWLPYANPYLFCRNDPWWRIDPRCARNTKAGEETPTTRGGQLCLSCTLLPLFSLSLLLRRVTQHWPCGRGRDARLSPGCDSGTEKAQNGKQNYTQIPTVEQLWEPWEDTSAATGSLEGPLQLKLRAGEVDVDVLAPT